LPPDCVRCDDGIAGEAVQCNIADDRSVQEVARLAATLGTVTSVVHTAGLSPKMGSVETILEVNALGTVHVVESFMHLARPEFSLVNVASSAGHMPGPAPTCAYALASTDPRGFVARLARRASLVTKRLRTGYAYALSKNFVNLVHTTLRSAIWSPWCEDHERLAGIL
jgi:NAD(P)-dependent dehydrogenase (short-subunit alcohol dehydrogenase family)